MALEDDDEDWRDRKWTLKQRLYILQQIGEGSPDGKILKTSDRIKAVQVYTQLVGDGAPERQDLNVNAGGELRDLMVWLRSGQRPS